MPRAHPPRDPHLSAPVDLELPGEGRWRVLNSPADRVPSHGTSAFASSYAIDLVPVDATGRSAPMRMVSWLLPESPTRFTGFGRTLRAPVAGVVVAALDTGQDHEAYRGLPSVRYALTQGRRAARGWTALAGNHVVIRSTRGIHVAMCHLRQGSLLVHPGDRVEAAQPVAACGSSGNSTEPHVHLQAMDGPDPATAHAVPITLEGALPRNGTLVPAQ